ncbi:Photosynthesis system II assembly factor YCF48 [Tenacibaculum sp. 190524A02b]|uniref:Photosynthesis system II assembly factor YCF48 n=1 Tax=Tenacibaculum vairaonense TaxID=3137860 RepID=A0ABM9PKP6_9FLAO
MKLLQNIPLIFFAIILINCSDSNNTPANNNDNSNNYNVTLTPIKTPSNLPLNRIQFIDAKNGFIVAGKVYPDKNSEILKTTDGGNTWIKVYENNELLINDISIKNKNEIYCVAGNGTILSSINGGTTWSVNSDFKNKGYYMNAIKFAKNNEAYIVGSKNNTAKGFILKTTNNGLTWLDLEKENTNPDLNFNKVLENNSFTSIHYFPPTNTLVFSGGTWTNGKITIRQNDFWDVAKLNESAKFMDVVIKNNFLLTVGNNGITNATTEKGAMHSYNSDTKIWQKIDYKADNKLTAVTMEENTIITVGRNKSNNLSEGEFISISKDQGKTWHRIAHEYVTAGWNDITSLDIHTFYAVGYNGLLVKIALIPINQ